MPQIIWVKVEEFAVGMGPKILGGKKGDHIAKAYSHGRIFKMLEDENNTDERSLNNKGVLKEELYSLQDHL